MRTLPKTKEKEAFQVLDASGIAEFPDRLQGILSFLKENNVPVVIYVNVTNNNGHNVKMGDYGTFESSKQSQQ